MEKVFIIGGRRGLGAAVAAAWGQTHPQDEITISSRQPFSHPTAKTMVADLNRDEDVERLSQWIRLERPTRVFCFAGGGPYGLFADKNLKDHLWALKVSFLAPMALLHTFMAVNSPAIQPSGQWVMTGSAIAESAGDANAASYAAAKHALVGLVSSLRAETPQMDIRLFSPGYMATDLLPAAAIKAKGLADVQKPEDVAVQFIKWAVDPQASWHRVCRS